MKLHSYRIIMSGGCGGGFRCWCLGPGFNFNLCGTASPYRRRGTCPYWQGPHPCTFMFSWCLLPARNDAPSTSPSSTPGRRATDPSSNFLQRRPQFFYPPSPIGEGLPHHIGRTASNFQHQQCHVSYSPSPVSSSMAYLI